MFRETVTPDLAARTPMQPTAHPASTDADGYFPIDLASEVEATDGLDIYLRHGSGRSATLYCAAGAPMRCADRMRLLRQGVQRVYAPLDQHHRFAEALLSRLDHADGPPDPDALRGVGSTILQEVLRSGGPESVRSAVSLADAVAAWLQRDREASGRLLDVAGHDYRTATHMLNVGVGCGLLALRLRPDDEDLLLDALQGGLLHDLGKRGVDERILNKQGALGPHEWAVIRRHPLQGAARLEGCAFVRPGAVAVVRDHHERLDGRGYPRAIGDDRISPPTRICAVVDAFDAVTAARPYRRPIHPIDALALMREGVGPHFDAEVFGAWETIVTEAVEAERERVAALPRLDEGDVPSCAIEKILQAPPEGMAPYIPAGGVSMNQYWDQERRSSDRSPVRLRVTAELVRVGKPGAVSPGDEVELVTVDLSSGGAQVLTPWAFSRGDVLSLRIPGPGGKTIIRHARVVRVRERSDGAWSAGLEFTQPLEQAPANEKPAA